MKITVEFDPNDERAVRSALKLFTEQLDYHFGKPVQAELFDDDPLKRMHTNYRNLLNAMISLFGYEKQILRNKKQLKEMRHEHKVDNLTDFIRALEARKIFEVQRTGSQRKRIESIKIRRF
jgi:hypothetical protein